MENKVFAHDVFGRLGVPKELEAAQPAFLNFMDNARKYEVKALETEKGLVQRKQMDRGLIDFDKFTPSLFNV